MARLHSKKKGKSGTKRPKSLIVPSWNNVDKKEVKDSIVRMAKEGTPSSKIGLHFRDTLGVPNLRGILGMSLLAFLKKEKVAPQYPEDLMNLIRKAVRLRSHLKTSKKDVHNSVKLGHVESKINRLAKYYVLKGSLPSDWKYDPEQVALLVK